MVQGPASCAPTRWALHQGGDPRDNRSCPLPDGSRIHWERQADGSWRSHRDLHDPEGGIWSALRHAWEISPAGLRVIIVALAGALAVKGLGFR
jgi:hypothetical protein